MANQQTPTYGDKRRPWHPAFIAYMNQIVDHPNYAGMPATRDETGKIDWTIPSNRKPGSKNANGNVERRLWWAKQADDLAVPRSGYWLSRVARLIHPFGEKPCQTCGTMRSLDYVYPTRPTVLRLNGLLPASVQLDYLRFLTISEVADYLVERVGEVDGRNVLASAFNLESRTTLNDVTETIITDLCAHQNRRFSPGAMANPPDRLDGYHTYNICCRAKQDTGRSRENLARYVVDRRAFEQWSQGEWGIADQVMARAGEGLCSQCSREGKITADHVGPISLGFAHSIVFRPLCQGCNSAKNNRMFASDVAVLLDAEAKGIPVVSWQARALWDTAKHQVNTDADALLLSKLMRINQHHFLDSLQLAVASGTPEVLLPLLHLERSKMRTELPDFDPATLVVGDVAVTHRQETYWRERAVRVARVAFEALEAYALNEDRNVQAVSSSLVEAELAAYGESLKRRALVLDEARQALLEALSTGNRDSFSSTLLSRVDFLIDVDGDTEVLARLDALMAAYQAVLAARFARGEAVSWNDD